MMNRNDKLMTMKGSDLIALAEKIGVKVACNKAHTQLKESKQAVIDRIIAKETETEKSEPEKPEIDEIAAEVSASDEKEVDTIKKEKKEQRPRKKKEQSPDVIDLLKFITTEWEKLGIIKTPGKENAMFRPLCAENGRQVIKLMWTTKKVSFFVRVEAAVEYAEKYQKINYAMPFQCMFFNDTEETRKNIKNIFALVLDNDRVRQKKEKKTTKTAE